MRDMRAARVDMQLCYDARARCYRCHSARLCANTLRCCYTLYATLYFTRYAIYADVYAPFDAAFADYAMIFACRFTPPLAFDDCTLLLTPDYFFKMDAVAIAAMLFTPAVSSACQRYADILLLPCEDIVDALRYVSLLRVDYFRRLAQRLLPCLSAFAGAMFSPAASYVYYMLKRMLTALFDTRCRHATLRVALQVASMRLPLCHAAAMMRRHADSRALLLPSARCYVAYARHARHAYTAPLRYAAA